MVIGFSGMDSLLGFVDFYRSATQSRGATAVNGIVGAEAIVIKDIFSTAGILLPDLYSEAVLGNAGAGDIRIQRSDLELVEFSATVHGALSFVTRARSGDDHPVIAGGIKPEVSRSESEVR